ncbi:solute carrier family 2, facilitated glucose transporter member 11 [Microcaecilia unicolor]|uniref:Solute carrier family 2, facilitated glucose transporter member 11-like n=1 Tax=Microcaecilia unicolor TaxID=1415580 RepID=A0A6P7ZGD6_9AMPH|nr:solute carrier family 2, facilitated glucose transporter member 11-like [Microcaecilia unicolor]
MECQALLTGTRSPSKIPSKTLFLAFCATGIGGSFQYGYNTSIINAPTKPIQKFINESWNSHYSSELDENLLTLLWSTIASVFTLGGLLGSHVGGYMAIKVGRKGALLMNNTIALLASLVMGISYPTGLFELLIVGRFLIGINAGIGICVQPLYLGEIAPKHLRGAMAVGSSIFLTGGILAGQIVGLRELLGGEMYWPVLLSTSWIPAAVQLLTLPWFPESPRYLLIDRQEEEKCSKALKAFQGLARYQAEMEDMQKESLALHGEKPKKSWELFTDRTVRWQLVTVILISAAQQLSGINAIYFYAGYIFTQAGIPAENIPYVTLGTGACECITALTCGLLIDFVGRRVLIIGGYTLMAFWCIVLTLTLTYQDIYAWVPYISMAAIFAFILSFGLGPGGVTVTLTAELFMQTLRPAAYVIGGTMGWLSFFIVGMLFPFIVNGLQQYCFLVFLVECCLIATFLFFVIPETKNKSFLEINQEFKHFKFGRRKTNQDDRQIDERV